MSRVVEPSAFVISKSQLSSPGPRTGMIMSAIVRRTVRPGDQTRKVSNPASAKPTPSIDQSPRSNPRSRSSVFVCTDMSPSTFPRIHPHRSRQMEAGLLPARNGRRKENPGNINADQIFEAYQAISGTAPQSRRPSSEVLLKCCICASVRRHSEPRTGGNRVTRCSFPGPAGRRMFGAGLCRSVHQFLDT
jgi:hypothetical protein